jgi:hypothetical protein
MVFTVGKCKVMHMGHQNPAFNYTMKGQVLEETMEEKDIGVMVTSNLKPSAQCARAAKTAQTVLGQISRTFHYRDRHVFLRLYKHFVRPHLEFSIPGLGTLDRSGQKLPREGTAKSYQDGFRAQEQYL